MFKKPKLKAIVALLLLASMGFVLTGCTSGDEPTPNNNTSVVPSDQPITLIWWNLFEPQENVQPVIDAYQNLHPNVTIEYAQKEMPDYQSSLDKVLTDNIPESTPDIFTIHNTWMGRYSAYTLPAPTQVIDSATYKQSFYSVAANDLMVNDLPHAVPLGMDSIAIIYNKKLLKDKGYSAPSGDWTELLQQAKAMTITSGNNITVSGLALAAEDDVESWFDVFNLLLMQSNVDMVNDSGTSAVFAQDEATKEAQTYFQSYTKQKIWNESLKQDVALFLEGKLAMFIAPSWRLLDIVSYNDEYNLGIDWGVAPMPQLSTLEGESSGWADYWAQTVALDSRNYKVAWDFLNFASQPEQLRLSYNKAVETRAFGQIYPRPDMKSELEENKYLSVYVDEVSHAKTWWMVDGGQVETAFKELLGANKSLDSVQTTVTNILVSKGRLSKK